MKKLVLTASFFLTFCAAGISQTSDVTGEIFITDGREAIVSGDNTGMSMKIVIENENVLIIPGERILIMNNGTENLIVIKANGEYIGKTQNLHETWTIQETKSNSSK